MATLRSYGMDRHLASQFTEIAGQNKVKYTVDQLIDQAYCGVRFMWLQDVNNNNKAAGFVGIKEAAWYQVELTHLVVAENFKRKGYGRKLLHCIEKAALSDFDARIIQCIVQEEDYEARGFFASCGGWKEVNIFELRGTPTIIMQKILKQY